MRNIVAIAKKELNIYFATPLAYALFAVMSILASYIFIIALREFQRLSMTAMQMPQYVDPTQLNLTDWVIAPVVYYVGFFVALAAPFLSMRLLAEEKRQKTFELLMTAPVRSIEIVLGKYLGGLTVMGITIALTLSLPLILQIFAGSSGTGGAGGIEWQTTLSAYFGLFLWSAAAMAIGLFISSLTDSQAVAAIVSVLVLVMFWFLGLVAGQTNGAAREVLEFLSATKHLSAFAKGVFDLKDLFFYLSWVVLGLFLTDRVVEGQRWA